MGFSGDSLVGLAECGLRHGSLLAPCLGRCQCPSLCAWAPISLLDTPKQVHYQDLPWSLVQHALKDGKPRTSVSISLRDYGYQVDSMSIDNSRHTRRRPDHY